MCSLNYFRSIFITFLRIEQIFHVTVVILTDDEASSNQRRLIKEAEKTKNQGIVLIVIGVGDEINEEALVSVASHNRLYTASSYEVLSSMGVRISVMLCQGNRHSVFRPLFKSASALTALSWPVIVYIIYPRPNSNNNPKVWFYWPKVSTIIYSTL